MTSKITEEIDGLQRKEIITDGYQYSTSTYGTGISCCGLVMWAYDRAFNSNVGPINNRPVTTSDPLQQWSDMRRRTYRMEQRFSFQGKDAVQKFLQQYMSNPAQFALEIGDPIYFLDSNGAWDTHVIMYISDGNVIQSEGYRGHIQGVHLSTLTDALKSFSGWFNYVGIGRISAVSNLPSAP